MTTFLADPSLAPLWAAVRVGLDRNGVGWRGRLTLPPLLPEGRRRLGIVLERDVTSDRRAVSLGAIVDGVERMTGRPFLEVLADLGHAPSGRREASLAVRAATSERRAALNLAVDRFAESEPWIAGWAAGIRRDGLVAGRSAADVEALVGTVVAVVACSGGGRSRTEIAAGVLGDAHALDSSTPLARLVTRALVERDGPDASGSERAVWERAGMPLDLVSAPVLTWGLPLLGDDPVAVASRAMTAAGLPLHLSTMAVRATAWRVQAGTPVLVVENPRLVEAAAERRLPGAVMCGGGNLTTAPVEMIAALRAAGATLRYHGDFDGPGLAITIRAFALGCEPWRMTAADYLAAVDTAIGAGVELPRDTSAVPATPWDDALAPLFAARREIVHEERVMDDVLAAHALATLVEPSREGVTD